MIATIDSEGGLNLPAELLRLDGRAPGEQVEIERLNSGLYRVAQRGHEPGWRLVDWLLACPEKDFFVPIPSESTDEL